MDHRLEDHVDEKVIGDWLSLASQCAALRGDDRPNIEEVGERLWEIWKYHRKSIGEQYEYERSWSEFVENEGILRGDKSMHEGCWRTEFPTEGRASQHLEWPDVSNQQFGLTQDDYDYDDYECIAPEATHMGGSDSDSMAISPR